MARYKTPNQMIAQYKRLRTATKSDSRKAALDKAFRRYSNNMEKRTAVGREYAAKRAAYNEKGNLENLRSWLKTGKDFLNKPIKTSVYANANG